MTEKTAQKEPGKKPVPSKKPKPQQEAVVQIPLSELHPFPDHPFQVREDVFIALLATKVSEAVRLSPGSDASTKLLNIMTGLNTAFHSLVPSFHLIDLCVGVAAAIAIRLAVYIKGKNAKKFRKNLEYGSARWSA